MRIAGVETCSFVNGEGCRYVVFVQGCKHHCKGCQNPDTWAFDGGREVPVEDIVADIKKHKFIDGITLSGGDPYYQQRECKKLLALLPDMNVWIYTGFEWNRIKSLPLTKLADTVVTGKFKEEMKCEDKMYGSSNQEIHHPKVVSENG